MAEGMGFTSCKLRFVNLAFELRSHPYSSSKYKIAALLSYGYFIFAGGRDGIRTHDTFDSIHTFQACAFNRSATLPL